MKTDLSFRIIPFLVVWCVLILSQVALGQATFESKASGTWNSSSTWNVLSGSDPNGWPDGNDDVFIRNGHTVTVGSSTRNFANLTVDAGGTLHIDGSGSAQCSPANGSATINGTVNMTSSGELRGDASSGQQLSISSGGQIIVGGTAVLANTGWDSYNFDPNSTVEYSGTKTIANTPIYGNLVTSGSGTQTLEGSGGSMTFNGSITIGSGTTLASNNKTIYIQGDWSNSGSFTQGTSTVVMNGAGTQSINGSTSTAFNNLTLSNTNAATSANTDFSVNGALTVNANAILAPSAAVVISGSGNLTGSGTVQVTRTAAPADFSSQYTIANKTLTNLTIEYISTGAQSLSALTYGNLEVNSPSGCSVSGAITINGTLTLTNGKVTLGSNTLTIASAGSISGGSSSSYVVTNSTGVLTRNGVGATNVVFPVGTSSSYSPVTINNAGTSDNFSVRVQSTFDNAPPSPTKVVNLQWTITEGTTGGSNATVTLQWNTANEAGSFVRTNPIYVGHYNGSQWLQTAASFADLGGGTYSATASGFTSFSPFGVGNDGALPIQLASFSASVVRGNDVEVTWKTVSETNNYGFEVYRKRDGTDDWLKIAFVNGHGTTLAPQSYSYLDRALAFGKYYYRIKQIDLDGKSEIFPKGTPSEPEMEVTVGVTPGAFVLAQNYPNPFNPSTQIEFVVPESGFVTLKVYNVLGQEVATLFEGSLEAGRINTVQLGASNLPSGLYFYTLKSTAKTETKRMILTK
jgi:hypothetical protein